MKFEDIQHDERIIADNVDVDAANVRKEENRRGSSNSRRLVRSQLDHWRSGHLPLALSPSAPLLSAR